MRIVHVVPTLETGGLERHVVVVASEQVRQGHTVSVLALRGGGPLEQACREASVDVHIGPGGSGVQPRLVWWAASLLRRLRADIVHTHHLGPWLYGGIAGRLAGARVVCTEHSVELYDQPRRRLLGRALGLLGPVVVVSSAVGEARQRLVGHGGIVVDNGVDVRRPRDAGSAARARLELEEDGPWIACIARLSPEKGVDLLLDAFARVPRSTRARLLLVGDGPERAALEQRAHALGIAERVRFLGRRDDVDDCLDAAEVVALASRREGQPLALLEAMAASKAIVATAVGGVPALLDDGCGVLSPADDADAFAAGLTHLLDDPALRARCGARARARVVERHSLDACVARLQAVYERRGLAA